MPYVDAKILVGEDTVSLPNNETAERPVAIADLKLPTPRIIQIVQTADANLLFIHAADLSFHGATLTSSNMPGIARAVQSRKKFV